MPVELMPKVVILATGNHLSMRQFVCKYTFYELQTSTIINIFLSHLYTDETARPQHIRT